MGIARNMVMNDILNMQAEESGATNKTRNAKEKSNVIHLKDTE